MPQCGILNMRSYTVSEAAKILGIDRRTLQRWVRGNQIPAPKAEIVAGRLSKSWTEEQIAKLREHKAAKYWGRGIDRRTGKKAKQKTK
jgi:excisionase family DNA binding protein